MGGNIHCKVAAAPLRWEVTVSDSELFYVCPECAFTRPQMIAWIDMNDHQVIITALYCSRCGEHAGDGEQSRLGLVELPVLAKVLAALEDVSGCCLDNEYEQGRVAIAVLRALGKVS